MKSIIDAWKIGWSYVWSDEPLVSFFTLFAVILAESIYLWCNLPAVAMPFTIILLLYILNVVICAWLNGEFEGTYKERIIGRIYLSVFMILIIIGCFINFDICIKLNIALFIITLLNVWLRNGNEKECIISAVLPTLILAIALFIMCANISFTAKIIILLLYILVVPFIAKFEDDIATCDIFEIFTQSSPLFQKIIRKLFNG